MLKAKKSLGQHFLNDQTIIEKIITSFSDDVKNEIVFEIGPGPGVLTEHLVKRFESRFLACELDYRLIDLLKKKYKNISDQFIHHDFISLDWNKIFSQTDSIAVIGNFPYNISTEIIFKILDHKNQVPLVVGMFQKEVAKRFASKHGNKEYGITSILTQAYYDIEYLFDVPASSFNPPPKVESGVIRLTRKKDPKIILNEIHFKRLVKAGFNQRRKTLRNALSSLIENNILNNEIYSKRAEQLSVDDWIELSNNLA